MNTWIHNARRIVIKFGTQILMDGDGMLAIDRLAGFVRSAASLVRSGKQVILVSSGAVGLGRQELKLQPPLGLEDKQACAAVGQTVLMNTYRLFFQHYGLTPAQVLLTSVDFSDRKRYLTLKTTMERLLELGTIPIINENDVVSSAELKEEGKSKSFGDNDKLSAILAGKLEADALLLITNVDGIYTDNPNINPGAQPIPLIESFDQLNEIGTEGKSNVGRGGMRSKLEAARIAALSGVHTIICSGLGENPIDKIFQHNQLCGTYIMPHDSVPARKHWIGFASGTSGAITINTCAKNALIERQASLLAVGITGVHGDFQARQVVSIQDEVGMELGRGLTWLSSEEIRHIQGHPSQDIPKILGRDDVDVVIQRDNLVIYQEYWS
jgi:glutamate 5-kinase